MTEYCEKTFTTTMPLDTFRKLALRTCKLPHWVILDARDRSQSPHMLIVSAIFSAVEDRDRFIIAMRFAEEERALQAADTTAKAPAKRGTAGHYAAA